MNPEFCIICGASFPPREGEGTCINWESCVEKTKEFQKQDNQMNLFGDPNIMDISPPL